MEVKSALQWRNYIWQSLEEGAGKRCSECDQCTQTFRRALTASVDSCAEIKSGPFNDVTKSGRVWRKVPENGARSVSSCPTTASTTSSQNGTAPHQTTTPGEPPGILMTDLTFFTSVSAPTKNCSLADSFLNSMA